MDIGLVMQAIADRLDTISDLNCYGYPADSVNTPAAVVDYPETYSYDETYGRGMDRLTVRVWVVVGRVSDRSTRDLLSGYIAGNGASSVKEVLETGAYSEFHTVRVVSVEFDPVTIGGIDLMSAAFELDIAGAGSS